MVEVEKREKRKKREKNRKKKGKYREKGKIFNFFKYSVSVELFETNTHVKK